MEPIKHLIGQFSLTNEKPTQNNDIYVQDSRPNSSVKRSFSCSDMSDHRNSDRNSVVQSDLSVSKSMPSMCTDNNLQYALKPSNILSTYDFALSTVHTIEKAENNGTVVTNQSTSTDFTSIKNNKDSNNNNTYESLRNYNTDLLSTNSSSISNTSEINRSLINLTANVRRNMRTAKSEMDNIFKGKFDKIKIADFNESDNSNIDILPDKIKDEDIDLTTKSSRHNQIVSLLTEIDETNLNENPSPLVKVTNSSNDEDEQGDIN